MNRVLSRATKLSKIIGKTNIFTKVNLSMNLKAIQNTSKLMNFAKMSFSENERYTERRFERFADSTGVFIFTISYFNIYIKSSVTNYRVFLFLF